MQTKLWKGNYFIMKSYFVCIDQRTKTPLFSDAREKLDLSAWKRLRNYWKRRTDKRSTFCIISFFVSMLSPMAIIFRELHKIVEKLNGMTETAQRKSSKKKGYSDSDFKSWVQCMFSVHVYKLLSISLKFS